MNLLEFTQKFPDEQSCINHLKEQRLKQGITCKKCETITKHYWLNSVNKFQCSVCRSRTNIKSGTIMEKSQLPIRIWFITIHLMTSTKKSFSALELQRQLGLKFYEPVWYMMLKIRTIMGKRDSLYKLDGNIEVDEGFFESVKPKSKKPLKRGRGSQKQTPVLVMTESEPINHNLKHKKKRVLGYVKMIVMDDLSSEGINYELKKSVDKSSTLTTDGWRGYNNVTDVVNKHKKMRVKPKDSMKKLPWVHTIISNVKRGLLGVHHSINHKYLQLYLNEFCYKLNRRNFEYRDSFDGLLIAGISHKWN